MRPFGARTVVEAAFLVAAPVIALEAGLGRPAVIGAGAIAYVLVLAVEGAIWREGKREGGPAARAGPDLAPEPEPSRLVSVPAPPPEPEPKPEPEPELPPVATVVPITSSPGPTNP